ncbi:ankyrin repeat-containing domain protein [Microdochium trichocladiopsis]|uniref:Ankyrin repeat-containing domain protein n=1 Tax=Microdochium trichocladiopsis TaxID=1682393 RepID=A0A9P8YGX1_9PEZI|nr:ankyrin repeat-containing domain protein [Microdochium trichocladiopsis]KAH7040070.1 ankyrin repeat-containing domain protein [Microdochium trichocladiopsis]
MAFLLALPTELLLAIASHLLAAKNGKGDDDDGQASLSCLTRTCKTLRSQLVGTLFAHNARHGYASALRYGAIVGDLDIINLALSHAGQTTAGGTSSSGGGSRRELPPDPTRAVEAVVDQCRFLPPRALRRADAFRDKIREETTRQCVTPLGCAALYGHADAVCALVDRGGADLEAIDTHRRTPLFKAVRYGHVDVIKALLERGANRKARNADGHSVLCVAVEDQSPELVEWMLSDEDEGGGGFGELVNEQMGGYGNVSALAVAVTARVEKVRMIEVLLKHGADVASRDTGGSKALRLAAGCGTVASARVLLEHGAPVDSRESRGRTGLAAAAAGARADMVELLLEYGADVEARHDDMAGETPLMAAAQRSATEVVRLLVEKGRARVDNVDDQGRTALTHAVLADHSDTARYLLEQAGADVDPQDHNGMTPLMLLLRDTYPNDAAVEKAKLLLAHGARVDRGSGQQGNGPTPLAWAVEKAMVYRDEPLPASLELMRMLVLAGADPRAPDDRGQTPLSLAGSSSLAEHLLRVSAEAGSAR